MEKEAKITLDGTEYTVRRLNVGQLVEIMPAFEDIGRAAIEGKTGPSTFQVGVRMLAIAMRRNHPDVKIADLDATPEELKAAIEKVSVLSGLKPAGEAAAGVTMASAPASSGTPSTESSPPAA